MPNRPLPGALPRRRRRRSPCLLAALAAASATLPAASAQLVNGQFFTPGLLVVDAPAPNGEFSAGSDINVALEVGGDGLIPSSNTDPGSGLATAVLDLAIFLVSIEQGVNLTVSTGAGLLQGESGSTVKHLNFRVPDCILPGSYDFTYYELSRINGDTFFSIYSTAMTIRNSNSGQASASCDGATQPTTTAQAQSPPPTQPFKSNDRANFALQTGKLADFAAATTAGPASSTTAPAIPIGTVSTAATTPVQQATPAQGGGSQSSAGAASSSFVGQAASAVASPATSALVSALAGTGLSVGSANVSSGGSLSTFSTPPAVTSHSAVVVTGGSSTPTAPQSGVTVTAQVRGTGMFGVPILASAGSALLRAQLVIVVAFTACLITGSIIW